MVEIGMMVQQCLNRRIADKTTLVSVIAHWERRRSRDRAGIDWMFYRRARSREAARCPVQAAAWTCQILGGEVLT